MTFNDLFHRPEAPSQFFLVSSYTKKTDNERLNLQNKSVSDFYVFKLNKLFIIYLHCCKYCFLYSNKITNI